MKTMLRRTLGVSGLMMFILLAILPFLFPAGASARKEKGADLRVHEKKGGHTIARHVGKSDQDLIRRLKKNRRISAASTFSTLSDAEEAVGDTLSENKKRVRKWAASAGEKERLVIKGSGRGRGIHRKDFNAAIKQDEPDRALRAAIRKRTRCRVVLQADGMGGYFVLTAYPE
ncbi:hypothetical protein DENIS_2155 [Desulfonema ishimotonii]|uniref:Bacterial CdiA-CT RNAse A domain-containing protein n=1 Tax=Desulfonema ishimotonii TaxID=45657 RepID=A0A401FW51_9BACT|nr:RNase A-like domain-containing protein [Desulfonema ishimotonii]GBC61195.1 hypothetical protein DENIS_2155 [Desulfonema ishimotonii]